MIATLSKIVSGAARGVGSVLQRAAVPAAGAVVPSASVAAAKASTTIGSAATKQVTSVTREVGEAGFDVARNGAAAAYGLVSPLAELVLQNTMPGVDLPYNVLTQATGGAAPLMAGEGVIIHGKAAGAAISVSLQQAQLPNMNLAASGLAAGPHGLQLPPVETVPDGAH